MTLPCHVQAIVDTWASCQSLCERDISAAKEAIKPLFTDMLEIFEDMQSSASSELNRSCMQCIQCILHYGAIHVACRCTAWLELQHMIALRMCWLQASLFSQHTILGATSAGHRA